MGGEVNILRNKYSGSCLIVGSSSCLYDDYGLALKYRPESRVIALNDAASVVSADFIVSLHPETMYKFREKSANKHVITLSGQKYKEEHDVDYWFTDCNSGGTSAGSAIKIAIAMGFKEIILCGCPLVGGDGYFDNSNSSCMLVSQRIGHMPAKHPAHKTHRLNLQRERDRYPSDVTVRSMSGNTAKIFGYPEFLEAA